MKKFLGKNEKGAMMVEATIYIPMVIIIVIAFIELALFNMQEYMMMYEAQRVSSLVARDIAYVGYDKFDAGAENEIDFKELPSKEQISAYYEDHNKNLKSLYREVWSLFGIRGKGAKEYSSKYSDAASKYALVAIGLISAPDIKIDTGLFGSGVSVTFTHEFPTPGVFKYLGYDNNYVMKRSAYTYAVNPSQFVRDVDLAIDLTEFLMDKLGLKGGYDSLTGKINQVLDKIL